LTTEVNVGTKKNYMTLASQSLALILAITCLGQFCISIISLFTPDEVFSWRANWPMAIMIIPGLSILKFIDWPPRYTIFSYAVFCGILQIVYSLSNIGSMSLIDYIDIFLGLMMITSGTHCLFGDRHSATRLLIISVVILILDLGEIFISLVYVLGAGTGLLALALSSLTTISEIIYMTFLVRRDVREEGIDRTLRDSMATVESMLTNSHEAFMYRDEIGSLLGEDRSRWVDEESGPIASRCTTYVYDEKNTFIISSKVWRSTGEIMISIDQDLKTEPFGKGFILRSHAFETTEDGEYLRLYGDDGMYLRILIQERPDKETFMDRFGLKRKDDDNDDLLEDIVSDED